MMKYIQALKNRVTNVENSVKDLQKDSDGDGVSDQFDKCPNTPAGTIVDGSGCPLVRPAPIDTSFFALKLFARTSVNPTSISYSNIQFPFNSSVLTPDTYRLLDATLADLSYTGASLQLNGFASSDEGSATHKINLSRDRANSVKTYLVKSGVAANKIIIKPFGQTHPIADNSTEAGRILNRRVEFKGIASIPNEENLIKFNPGQSGQVLNPKLIDAAIKALTSNNAAKVTLVGHCSSAEPFSDDETLKSDRYKKLALARLKTVVSYLVIRGIALNRIVQVESSDKPFNGDDTSINGQADNRSVEINVK
jgi:outer membrane protein OmpA-like peptidoglycan-associated protein